MLQGAEKRYTQIEKLALALVITARKLRPYFQSHKIIVLTNHPLGHIMTRPDASGRLGKWAVELGEYDVEYQSRTTVKAQALADFVVEFAGPDGIEIEVAARLSFAATNNEAEYEALIIGLQLAHEAGERELNVCTDSQLVAMQIEGAYETRERTMAQYLAKLREQMTHFDKCTVQQIPWNENERADALSKFGAMIAGVKSRKVTIMIKEQSAIKETKGVQIIQEDRSWKAELVRYLKDAIILDDPIAAKRIKFKAIRRKVASPEDDEARLLLANTCEGCDGIREEMRELPKVRSFDTLAGHSMESVRIACPFDQWGIDIVGPFPPAVAQKKFTTVAVEYFTKWVEAEAVARISEKEVINFIWKNIICRFGIPRVLISDNDIQFQGKTITAWCRELKIQQNFTAVGNPQANGQTEVTNRTILQHLKTRLEGAKSSWVEELPGVLWVYRTTPRSSRGEIPFCLVNGTEAIIPVEVGEETQRVSQYDAASNQRERAFDLTMIEEKRDTAYARILHHKGLMIRSYNQKIRPIFPGRRPGTEEGGGLEACRKIGPRMGRTLQGRQNQEAGGL
ncbi:UNVERIFIED_CONTAM: Ribonuclease HI [Sesamum radiatum]|uniref:Ribonuclease HI n=1 Tax=Sesamum radiatum TaxID=300843 RepID=A0AAW2PKI1_SESRA